MFDYFMGKCCYTAVEEVSHDQSTLSQHTNSGDGCVSMFNLKQSTGVHIEMVDQDYQKNA